MLELNLALLEPVPLNRTIEVIDNYKDRIEVFNMSDDVNNRDLLVKLQKTYQLLRYGDGVISYDGEDVKRSIGLISMLINEFHKK